MSAIYRVRQFVQAVGAWVEPRDAGEEFASRYLPAAAMALFRAMPHYDRQHALNVCRTLQQQGYVEPDLLAAALLHDVGKTVHPSGGVRLWHRVATVLLRAFWPALLDRLGQDRPGSWRRPFFVQRHHAAIGADLARQAGCSPVSVGLIGRHEDPPEQGGDPLLAALQAADSLN